MRELICFDFCDLVFCYAVENNLAVPITVEDFGDDQLGPIFAGPQVVAPHTKFEVTKTAEIAETTVNTGTVQQPTEFMGQTFRPARHPRAR